MKYFQTLWIVLILSILSGCSSSYITRSWRKPDAQIKNFSKIMVIGVIRESDTSLREQMENHLVGDLKVLGYNAHSSLAEYGRNGFAKMDSLAAYKKLKSDQVDAVLTIVLLDKSKEKFHTPNKVFYTTYGAYQNGLWMYYNAMLDRINNKDYYEIITKYFWESNFYDLDRKELVYSVQTQFFDPVSTSRLGHEYGLLITKNMVKSAVLTKQSAALKPM
jgi:hypothetical protein